MKILALDTTGEFGSIALWEDNATVAEVVLHSRDGFAHIVFGEMESLLCKAAWTVNEIDCFAAAGGPGSFTGIRVGLTAIKGLAEAAQKPVAAISNLRALAVFGTEPRRSVMLDARRGDIYAAVYDAELRTIVPDVVIGLPAWLNSLDDGDYEFISATGDGLGNALLETRFGVMRYIAAPRSLASAIAHCAQRDARDGTTVPSLAADANYVRRSDAELYWKDR
jgi:tRNA threonylcarbamoyladenosine biosynthesis protein TsaB